MTALIDLTKKAKIVLEKKNLINVEAQVVVVIDESYSMDPLFNNNTVQDTITRLLGIGMNMDVDKSIEVYGFANDGKYVGAATQGNHENFVRQYKMKGRGGTDYAPVMQMIVNKHGGKKKGFGGLFGKKEETTVPTFVIFITDGNNSDKAEAEKVIRESSKLPIFWQFVGIGWESFSFLQKLDDLQGRTVDNADFFKIESLSKMSDENLYEQLLNEFPGWLKEVKTLGILK